MMDKPISVGDLVQVVRPAPCCGGTGFLGSVFVVDWMDLAEGPCSYCGCDASEVMLAGPAEFPEDGFPLSALKRIPPLGEIESEEHEDEIHA